METTSTISSYAIAVLPILRILTITIAANANRK